MTVAELMTGGAHAAHDDPDTTTTTTTTHDSELSRIERDLRETGRSIAADRRLAAAWPALDTR